MMILTLLAGGLLVLATALLFGPQLVAYGPGGLRDAMTRPEARLAAGGLAAAFAWLLFAPSFSSVLIPGGEAVQVEAVTYPGPFSA